MDTLSHSKWEMKNRPPTHPRKEAETRLIAHPTDAVGGYNTPSTRQHQLEKERLYPFNPFEQGIGYATFPLDKPVVDT